MPGVTVSLLMKYESSTCVEINNILLHCARHEGNYLIKNYYFITSMVYQLQVLYLTRHQAYILMHKICEIYQITNFAICL